MLRSVGLTVEFLGPIQAESPRKAWHSIHVDKALPPIPQTTHSSVFPQAGLEGSI